MKILFVASGNKNGLPGAVIKNQGDSLKSFPYIHLDYYLIKGKGFWGYLRNVFQLRGKLKTGSYDLIHAHGLSSFTATLTFFKPVIVSLMGSEVLENRNLCWIYRFFITYFWDHTIIKSDQIIQLLDIGSTKNISVIPNGVDISFYIPLDKEICKIKMGFSQHKKTILFLADPSRKSKNFALADSAVNLVYKYDIDLKVLHGLSTNDVVLALNAADVLLLCSLWEGSPNIVKEAMACNIPIVATDVGDISWLFGEEPGHYLSGFNPSELAGNIESALDFCEGYSNTNGRKRIIELGLDSDTISKRIINIYRILVGNEQ